MTSVQSLSALRPTKSNDKLGKGQYKVVKPILKRWPQSEKNSLDLDRSWEEQTEQFQHHDIRMHGLPSFYEPSGTFRSGSARDVSFAPTADTAWPGSGGTTIAGGRRFNHTRSTSGTSHVSISTTGSGSGIGTRPGFVHPFQQVPRTATPPLSYANSVASLADGRDYSPTIAEDEDFYDYDMIDPTASRQSLQNQYGPGAHGASSYSQSQLSLSNSNYRRPSIASHRTNSFSEPASQYGPLRVNTGSRSSAATPAPSSRLAHVSSQMDNDLDTDLDSPTGSYIMAGPLYSFGSPTSTSGPITPFSRSSLEGNAFPRIRSKSDLDTATRAEQLMDARKKFEAREQAKDERYAREEIKKRERADNKRAQEMEKQAAVLRKERDADKRRQDAAALAQAMPRGHKHARKLSANSSGRPSTSRRPAPSPSLPGSNDPEKFVSGKYDSMETSKAPIIGMEAGGAHSVVFESPKRSNTAKRKTHGAWTAFILWFRTRLVRVNNKDR